MSATSSLQRIWRGWMATPVIFLVLSSIQMHGILTVRGPGRRCSVIGRSYLSLRNTYGRTGRVFVRGTQLRHTVVRSEVVSWLFQGYLPQRSRVLAAGNTRGRRSRPTIV